MISPAPKPNASLPASRTEIKKVSDKQRAKREKNGERFISSTIAKSSLLDPHFRTRKSIPRRNKKRQASEFARCYHSRGRVGWVKLQPCMGGQPHGCSGPIENAHVANDGEKGMGRKSGYKTIAPLCRSHHRYLHRVGAKTYEAETGVKLEAIAAQTHARWLLHVGRTEECE